MARQRIHNSRAGHGAGNSGASWISYSDMMAALLLIFVLILSYSLYEYFTMMETKTAELDAAQAVVAQQQLQVEEKQAALDKQTAQLQSVQAALDEQSLQLQKAQAVISARQEELDAANATLATKEEELTLLQSELANKQLALDAATDVLAAQKEQLAAQTQRIDSMLGLRTKIVQDLSDTLAASGLKATVDKDTGDIVLESAVFFEFNSYTLSAEGKAMLDRFLPAYMSVLLSDQYRDYLGEIIIEGHTDTVGEYMTNLALSQNRAQTVVNYCLTTSSLTQEQRELLRTLIVPKGKSYNAPVYNADGTVNQDKSRRVEFKFSLKDTEMITELSRILQQIE